MNAPERFPRASLPRHIKSLPVDPRGFPIPWFVATLPDGTRDFRITSPKQIAIACRDNRCWVCGDILGKHLVFVIGPMCAINRVSSEPPSHRDCALFAVQHCPFLSRPLAKRNDEGLEGMSAPGFMIARNPGVICLWTTGSFNRFPASGGYLIRIGEPMRMEWFCEGRPASLEEVNASVASGLPALMELAEEEGPAEIAALYQECQRFERLLLAFPPEG